MSTNDNEKGHRIEFDFRIRFNVDKVAVHFSGEAVEFEALEPNAPVRPRHLKIVTAVHELMREYLRNNG